MSDDYSADLARNLVSNSELPVDDLRSVEKLAAEEI